MVVMITRPAISEMCPGYSAKNHQTNNEPNTDSRGRKTATSAAGMKRGAKVNNDNAMPFSVPSNDPSKAWFTEISGRFAMGKLMITMSKPLNIIIKNILVFTERRARTSITAQPSPVIKA